jgi:hypothetical protein
MRYFLSPLPSHQRSRAVKFSKSAMGSTFKVASIWDRSISLHHVEATLKVDPTENLTTLPDERRIRGRGIKVISN